MTRRIAALAPAVFALSLPAAAQTTFERMEEVSEAMNALMNEALVAEFPALEGNTPDPAWDDPLRAAYRCVYDGYIEAAGEDAVAAMVDEMEEVLATINPMELLQGGGPVDQPEGISDDEAVELVNSCGVVELFMARMAESGAFEIMMQQ